jgi:hypothetical protein
MPEHTKHGGAGARTEPPGVAEPFRIFLNYRREDTAGHAGRMWDALSNGIEALPGFDETQIFMDIDNIEPGVDFREAIRQAVQVSDVFLTVIGKHWLTATDSNGRRRLDNPADFVRVEIEAALERAAEHHDVRVVPIRVQGADMPGIEDLPIELAGLAHRNAIELTDERWHYDVGRLLASMKKLEREKLERSRAERERFLREQPTKETRRHVEPEPAGMSTVTETSPVGVPERAEPREPPLRPETEQGREEKRRQRNRKLAVGGAILAAIAAGVALLIALLPDGQQSTETQQATSTTPPSLPGGSLVWKGLRGVAFAGEGEQAMTSIVNGPLGYVAGGFDTSSGDRDGSIWTSNDGRKWRRIGRGQPFEGAGDQKINSVAYFAGEAVAGGTNGSTGDPDAALWRSSDGSHWESVLGLAVPGTSEIKRLTGIKISGTRVLAAAGWQSAGGERGQEAAVWIFQSTLDPVEPVLAADFGGAGDQRINRVVQLKNHGGRLVAVGLADGDAGVWVSDDGDLWARVNVAELRGEGDQEILDAALFAPGVVAVGTETVDGETKGVAWFSADGDSWARASDPEGILADPEGVLADPGPVLLNRVFSLDTLKAKGFPSLVAGGSAQGDAAVWTWNDGVGWLKETDLDGALGRPGVINSFRATEKSVLAVGASGFEGNADALVLIGARR